MRRPLYKTFKSGEIREVDLLVVSDWGVSNFSYIIHSLRLLCNGLEARKLVAFETKIPLSAPNTRVIVLHAS